MSGQLILCEVLLTLLTGASAPGQVTVEPAVDPVETTEAPVEEPAPKVERPTGPVESCVTTECHIKVVSGRALHGPTAQRQCGACHVDADVTKHTYNLAVPKPELCSYCHTQSERSVIHQPVADKDCDKCHDPHGTDNRLQLLGDPSGSLCFPCHKAERYASRRQVDDHAEIVSACNVCHESHSSWMPKLLPKEQQELCLYCHENLRSHLELIGRPHAPMLDGKCLDCHDAHTTEHPWQLREGTPQLCYSCHEHDNIRKLVESSAFVHGAVTDEESCNSCHLGHGSVMPGLLADTEKALCLSCHSELLPTKDGRVLADIGCLLKENPRHHGPIRDGQCMPCHDSHASSRRNLLTLDYPQSFYAPFDVKSYALCFECHVEKLVLAEQAIGATEFRDAERNLHLLHVNRETRGRTCTTCHDVHASSEPFLMCETVPFGPRGWKVEINYTRSASGGSCASGCHETQLYNRGEGEMPKAPRAGLKPELLE
ncbi:MAG: hypothetical protein JSU63_02770 [Phycisphaerales bacterium]|nr:MAG: hypothetical protein JSU63_02770 [Phycisphaerales bacterium]